MKKITDIHAIEILDSRGYPTIKTFVTLDGGITTSASVPSGASVGQYEAYEFRDHDASRYQGKGVLKAINNVNTEINQHVRGMSIERLQEIDQKLIELDGTENKKRLGANAILSVSLGLARALAKSKNQPLWKTLNEYYFADSKTAFPRLMVNVVNGGKHAAWNFDIQEFLVIPTVTAPQQAVRVAAEIFHQLGEILKKEQCSTLVGDEGGYSPVLASHADVFEHIINAIMHAGYKHTVDVDLGIDSAASSFYANGMYNLKKEEKILTSADLMTYYLDLRNEYGLFSFEDPLAEEDWEGFRNFTRLNSSGAGRDLPLPLIIGDDLYTTNPERIKKGIEEKTTNAVLIKPNQIGTLKETVNAIRLSQQHGLKTIISHRSGETEDAFIADLAVAAGADFLKAGAMSRSERLAKYNRLIEIKNNL